MAAKQLIELCSVGLLGLLFVGYPAIAQEADNASKDWRESIELLEKASKELLKEVGRRQMETYESMSFIGSGSGGVMASRPTGAYLPPRKKILAKCMDQINEAAAGLPEPDSTESSVPLQGLKASLERLNTLSASPPYDNKKMKSCLEDLQRTLKPAKIAISKSAI